MFPKKAMSENSSRATSEVLDITQAEQIAKKAMMKELHGDFAILTDKTIEKSFGWVFFAAPKKYLETHKVDHLVPGIGPLVVDRHDGTAHFLSTSVSPGKAIAEYERLWKQNSK